MMNDAGSLHAQLSPARAARRGALAGLPRVAVEAGVMLAFAAVILATNYALVGYPNVKLFDLMVFTAGYTLGLRRGAAVAIGAWLIYGNFNPHGPTTLPLLLVVTASEIVYVAAGALLRRVVHPSGLKVVPGLRSLLVGGVAIACTLTYDVFTNVYTGVHWAQLSGSTEYLRWVVTAIFNPGALYFTAAHVCSNFVFFTAFAPALMKGIEKLKGEKSA